MRQVHTFAFRTPILLATALLGAGFLVDVAAAVEPLASRGSSRIGAIDPILGTTGILMMTVGLAVMGVTRLRFAPRPVADVPGRAVVLQRQAPQVEKPPMPPSPGAALIDALAATSEALDELAGSLPRKRRLRIAHAAHRVAAARALLEAHNARR